jgi:diaminopimelate epimerase
VKLSFTKMHGLGNDFVVIDATRRPFRPTPAQARLLADRRLGVGCDQILVLEPPSSAAPDANVDFDYRIYNSDGSESGQCGNGARCLALFAHEQKLSAKPLLRVRTSSTVLELEQRPGGLVRVNMGVPRFEPADIPFDAAARAKRYTLNALNGNAMLEIGVVSIGNPHAVLEVPDVTAAPVAELGAALQKHPAFPQSVNVGFLQIIDSAHARFRVYERGAGETLACGSGACAAAVLGRLWDKLGEATQIELPGGVLTIEWAGEGRPVYMTGPAVTVYRGELAWAQES